MALICRLGGGRIFFPFFLGGGGNHVVFRWIVRGIMISRRLQSIWVGTIENWQSIYCQWRRGGGGRAGAVAVTRILQRFMVYHFENIYQHFLLTFLRPRKWTLTSTSLVMNSGLKYVFLIGTTASSSSSSSLMHWGLTSMSSWFNSTFVLLSGKLIKSADSSNSPHSVDRVGKE